MELTSTLIYVVFFITCVLVVRRIKKPIRIRNYARELPTPKGHPILGHFFLIFGTPRKFWNAFRKLSLENYPLYTFTSCGFWSVNLLSPEDIEVVLTKKIHNKKTIFYSFLECWLGTGLLTSAGQKWHRRRKILTPAFHFTILKNYISVFNKQTEVLIDNMWKSSENGNKIINISQIIPKFALQVINETSMGAPLNEEAQEVEEYKKAIHDIGSLPVYRTMSPWLSIWLIYVLTPYKYKENRLVKILHSFSNKVIRQREQMFLNKMKETNPKTMDSYQTQDAIEIKKSKANTDDEESSKNRLSMLDILLNVKHTEKNISNEGIREEVDTFMFEGHDTISVAVTFGLMLIANHKEVQDRLVEEINTLLDPVCPSPTYQDLQKLDYMERVIKEILRLYPPVHFISRTLGEDTLLPSGYFIAEGTMVNIHMFDIHRHPKNFPDPEKFDPDRFLPENIKGRHPYSYIPFSAGPRNCIGQKYAMLEMKACFWGILSKFELIPVTTPESVKMYIDIVIRTEDPIKMIVKLRK